MEIETKSIVSGSNKTQEEFYTEIEDAKRAGWVEATTIHKFGLSFCILYKEKQG